MSKHAFEVDCTRRCKSRSHGQLLTSAITKRSVTDGALAGFIRGTCANFTKAFDFEGRTALHMSSSRGRTALTLWLARHSPDAFVNARDRESGYTPLHRCLFYGQIHTAVALIKYGVNTDIVDKDDYKALEHTMLDRQYMLPAAGVLLAADAYVWGSNSNYTLGTGTQQQRHVPELLSCFTRLHADVQQVHLGKFHSVFLTSGGEAWCGGQLARAGGPHCTALRPAPLKLPEPCIAAALTLDSTVLLMQSGAVLQYTLTSTETVSQSTTKTPSTIKLPNIKPLKKLTDPLGVTAGKCHAVVWTKQAVYTWGTNLGQLGHSQEDKFVSTPRKVAISMNNKEETKIQLVSAADAATILTTSRGDVYLLHKHIAKKIAIKQINLRQVCVDAKASDSGVYSRVTVLLLTNVGQLLVWQDTTNRLTRCVFGLTHQTVITNVTITHDAFYFITKYGVAFIGHLSRKATPTQPQPIKREKEKETNKSALVKFLEKDDCTSVRIVRIPNVHRAVSIAVDGEGVNFACLQTKPSCGLRCTPELSPSSLTKHMATLKETASEDDILHDVIFKVGTKIFPAHIFIIASSSEHLYKLYQEQPKDKPMITLDNVHPEVFERILNFMYTGTCDVAELGPCGLKIRREDLVAGKKEKDNNNESDADIDSIENPSEVSAFEVYEKQQNDKAGKRNRSRRSNETPPRTTHCDPVKLVQAGAKRLQVMGLHKLLDKFYYKNGSVCLKESATFSKTPPAWDRDTFPELSDTNVCTKDGMLISAHKCVLAARLEYFQGMFMHSWTESKLLSTVTIPINHGILLPVINFLYTDSCPEIESSDSIDFICSMLIVSDQLFIGRLREMCEVALANLVTLKNCTELCQFAHTYNATQLKQCCMEFISLNLCPILESRSLDALEDALLQDITQFYCKFNPIMSSRIITPFYNAPSDELVEEIATTCPVDLEHTDLELKREDILEKEVPKKKRQSKKIEYTESEKVRMKYESVSTESEKARMRYESVSSVTSLDLSNDTSGDVQLSLRKITKETEKEDRSKSGKWIEVPSAQQKQQKVVLARLKAINSAKDILNETPNESFTLLAKTNSFSAVTSPQSRLSVSPKDSPLADLARSPQGNLVISHVGPKLSQKQRKKLALQGEGTSPQSVDNFFAAKYDGQTDTPKNPWKICETPVASCSPKSSKAMEFNQILADQKKQKDDFSRIMTKPLNLTQLEDKAIEELERFYNAHEVDDEWITVRRIELQVSSPQWITANKST